MSGDIPSGLTTPGSYDAPNSVGARIIPERFFPNFDIRLQQNNFFNGETVKSKSASGTVEFWDDKTNTLRISSVDTFVTDEIIRGSTSRTEGVATEIRSYESYLKMGATSEVLKGTSERFWIP